MYSTVKSSSLEKGEKRNKLYKRFRSKHKIDKIFLELTDSDKLEEIKKKVSECVQIANKNNLSLPTDDPFELVVHPDKTWELVILDLDLGSKTGENAAFNEISGRSFISYIQEIRKGFTQKKDSIATRLLSKVRR